jgi:hypothetical protein
VADTKISGLSAGAPAQATDLIPIARSGANFSITPANILAYGSSPVAGTTGTFTGGVDKLTTATGVVSVAASTAPTTGQVLTATSGTAATWQTPSAGNLASPGPIGGTTPGSGAFTTLSATGATTLSAALTYGGVTLSNAVTGTGNMVLSASPTFTGTVTAATLYAATGSFRQGSVNAEQVAGTTSTSSFLTATSSNWALGLLNNSTTPYGLGIAHNTDSNGTGNDFLYCTGGGTLRCSLRSNGGLANVQANNANVSDLRTKKNIELAGSYLDKICAIPVKTFLYKDQTDKFLNLGVIAQDVESVAPELIDSGGFGDTPEDGVPLKAIYQTDLQFALMKAIQELAAKVAKLEAA